MAGIGKLVALTPNDEVNALACVHLAATFGRAEVFQVTASDPRTRAHLPSELRGRPLFRQTQSIGALDREIARGAEIKATTLSTSFDLAAHLGQHGPSTLLLGRLVQGKRLELYSAERVPEAAAGDVVLSLVDAARSKRPGESATLQRRSPESG
jgi:hypothetical protein